MTPKIKILTGKYSTQYTIIPAAEAHIAYYLFANPEKRWIFSNGKAILGEDIRGIEPAYHETMGWNPQYQLNAYDMNELEQKGVTRLFRQILPSAKKVSELAPPQEFGTRCSLLAQKYTPELLPTKSTLFIEKI